MGSLPDDEGVQGAGGTGGGEGAALGQLAPLKHRISHFGRDPRGSSGPTLQKHEQDRVKGPLLPSVFHADVYTDVGAVLKQKKPTATCPQR